MADIEKGNNPADYSFQAPTENVDGTPVTGPLTYSVYRKSADGDSFGTIPYLALPPSLVEVAGRYTVPIENFVEGRHIIALTATDADGDESAFSNTLGFSINVAPNPPLLLAS